MIALHDLLSSVEKPRCPMRRYAATAANCSTARRFARASPP